MVRFKHTNACFGSAPSWRGRMIRTRFGRASASAQDSSGWLTRWDRQMGSACGQQLIAPFLRSLDPIGWHGGKGIAVLFGDISLQLVRVR